MQIKLKKCLTLVLCIFCITSIAAAVPKHNRNTAFVDHFEIDNGAEIVRVTRATPVLPPGVTDDTPDLDRTMVMLDISPELYGESASRVIDASKIFGSLLMNSARRFATLAQYFKPLLQKSLNVKGLYPPPPSTTNAPKTTTTTIESNDI